MTTLDHQNQHSRFRTASAAVASACVLTLAFGSNCALGQIADAQQQGTGEPSTTLAPSSSALPAGPDPRDGAPSLVGTPKRVVLDLFNLVQFPGHIRGNDERWLLPLTAATVTSFALDEKTMSEVVTSNPSTNATSGNVSDALRYGFISAPILMYGAGLTTHDEHLRETGILGGEAMADAYIAGDLIKLASFRERPNVDRSEGSFYRTSAGYDSSFISGHSLTAWSSAAVIASEYPNKWVRISAYTAASGVSLTRILAQQHFPSDVLLGSAAGWLIGRYVYRHHSQVRTGHIARLPIPAVR